MYGHTVFQRHWERLGSIENGVHCWGTTVLALHHDGPEVVWTFVREVFIVLSSKSQLCTLVDVDVNLLHNL